MPFVYVLKSKKDNTYYIGYTSRNVEERLKEHNNGKSRYTKGHRPYKLIKSKEVKTLKEAKELESSYKRKKKVEHVLEIMGSPPPIRRIGASPVKTGESHPLRHVINLNLIIFNNIVAVKITYFVHGTTLDNEKEISSGWFDVELSELGVQQSKELWDKIKDKHFDVVFCSDLKRAVHSAESTFKDRVKIIQDNRLRECNYGKYNANPSEIVEPMQEENITKKFTDGESYEDVKDRISDFLDFLKKNYDGKSVAIVAHKAPQLALDVLLKNKTWEQAFADDWRKTKAWQPGWDYSLYED